MAEETETPATWTGGTRGNQKRENTRASQVFELRGGVSSELCAAGLGNKIKAIWRHPALKGRRGVQQGKGVF